MALPKILFAAQPLAQLQGRYAQAVREVYDTESILLGTVLPASKKPEHVFDCEDGMRMIVSRELFPDGERAIHVSTSVEADSRLYKAYRRLKKHGSRSEDIVAMHVALSVKRYQEISGDTRKPPDSVYQNGVVHFLIPDNVTASA